MNITITDKAKKKLTYYQTSKRQFLRINVIPGGCSGMSYDATIDDKATDKDVVIYEDESTKIVSDERSSLFLEGLHIDFSDDLIQAGFRLTNPHAAASCACGSSFSV